MRISTLFFLLILIGCDSTDSNQIADNQGIFDFPDVMKLATAPEIPDYLDAEKVLCKGKGLKVARCISGQLKTGKCLGIIKEGTQVYVVEIDCAEVKEEPIEEVDLGDQ